MLDLTRDAAGDVELGAHRDAGLADLAGMLGEACVDGGAAGADLAAQDVGQLVYELEVLLRTPAVAAGDDDAGTLDVDRALLEVALDDAHGQVGVLDELLPLDGLALAPAGLRGVLLAHDALADGRHLRPVVGVDDRGDDVAAESGTDLIEKILVFGAGLHIRVVADLKRCAVGGETAVEG